MESFFTPALLVSIEPISSLSLVTVSAVPSEYDTTALTPEKSGVAPISYSVVSVPSITVSALMVLSSSQAVKPNAKVKIAMTKMSIFLFISLLLLET